jgi:NAD(P)-dependent dehydrogenase (short-subunit alcohol dehydrogenase family)
MGRAISLRLAADGFAVIVGDLNAAGAVETAALATEAGGRALGTALVVTSDAGVAAAIAAGNAEFGPVDIIVNNA